MEHKKRHEKTPTKRRAKKKKASLKKVRVINIKQSLGTPDEIYVGRPSPLGNPFIVGGENTREGAVRRYDNYFQASLNSRKPNAVKWAFRLLFLYAKAYGEVVTLVCHCKPLACHADIIARELEKQLRKARKLRHV